MSELDAGVREEEAVESGAIVVIIESEEEGGISIEGVRGESKEEGELV